MNVHRYAFQTVFSITCDESLPFKGLSYVPIIGQIGWGIILGLSIYGYKKEKNLSDMDKAFFRAFLARGIISVCGAGPLLIPVDAVGIIMNCYTKP